MKSLLIVAHGSRRKESNDEKESIKDQNVQNDKNSNIIMIDIGNGVKAKINKNELKKVN